MMASVAQEFGGPEDFEILLAQAQRFTENVREEDFVAGLRERFERYGRNMAISDNQVRWLRDIAGRI